MLQILNKTPFEASLNLFTDQHGSQKVSVAVKATFNVPAQNDKIELAEPQAPVLNINEYFGEPGKSSIKYPYDLVLGKINTDIGLVGSAHVTDNRAVEQLSASLQVGSLKKEIAVFGDRYWKKRKAMPGFYITEPKPFKKMPLIYELAFGGIDETHENKEKHGRFDKNPLGTGFCINKQAVDDLKLPNLEDPENLISSWKDKPDPACFGFIEHVWGDCLKYAGSYDDNWRKNQFPLLPDDFDLRFFNNAALGLVADGFLKGRDPVKMINLSEKGILEFNLPEIKINFMFRIRDDRFYEKADIWTVVFEPDQDRFYMVWGGSFDIGKQPSQMKYVKIDIDKESGNPH